MVRNVTVVGRTGWLGILAGVAYTVIDQGELYYFEEYGLKAPLVLNTNA